jgi:hypothetical protein
MGRKLSHRQEAAIELEDTAPALKKENNNCYHRAVKVGNHLLVCYNSQQFYAGW